MRRRLRRRWRACLDVLPTVLVAVLVGAAIGAVTMLLTTQANAARGERRGCEKTFTIPMGERAARAVYRGHRHVSLRNLRMLGSIEACQRNPRARPFMRWFDHRQARLHFQRVLWWRAPWQWALASWYQLAIPGPTASGMNYWFGVANRTMPFGTRIEFCLSGCVTATVDDRGPFVYPREFDLNQYVARAIGFSGVESVRYRVLP